MIYGEEKHRQMARSILPAKRNGARTARQAKSDVNREYRRRNAHTVRQLKYFPGDCDSHIFDDPTLELKYVVRRRREADKLNHFEWWAERITRNVPVEQRLHYMRAILPGGLVGVHAMLHLRYHPAFSWMEHDRYMGPYRWPENDDLRKKLISLAEAALESGLHAKLNTKIKMSHESEVRYRYLGRNPFTGRDIWSFKPNPGEPRLLLGSHDVEAFVGDIIRGTRLDENSRLALGRHPEWLQTFRWFCQRHNL